MKEILCTVTAAQLGIPRAGYTMIFYRDGTYTIDRPKQVSRWKMVDGDLWVMHNDMYDYTKCDGEHITTSKILNFLKLELAIVDLLSNDNNS